LAEESERSLLELFKRHALLHGEFTLASGAKSSYYFDGRMLTLLPEGAYLVAKKVFQLLAGKVDAIGGLSLGADPIVAAVALISHLEGQPIPAFIVRAEVKKHGTQKKIEGHLPKGGRVAIVDDVITTGGSVFQAIEAVEAEGCRVVKVIALLDRDQGGSDELKRRGYDFVALLKADASGEILVA
jgi:orotate phosphoribosyltransferase